MNEKVLSMIIQGILALVLFILMAWIIIEPVSDEATKGALVIISSAAGFIFGRQTAPHE